MPPQGGARAPRRDLAIGRRLLGVAPGRQRLVRLVVRVRVVTVVHGTYATHQHLRVELRGISRVVEVSIPHVVSPFSQEFEMFPRGERHGLNLPR